MDAEADCFCDSEALLRSPYSPSGILRQALPLAKRGEAQASADRGAFNYVYNTGDNLAPNVSAISQTP